MLDRSKRRQIVSTLRFWTNADIRTELKHRRKIQQPLSLILQLVSLEQAVAFAQRAQRLQGQKAGEIVFIGAGRVREQEAGLTSLPPNMRIVSVGTPQENVGLRKIGMRRNAASPDTWNIFVAVRN